MTVTAQSATFSLESIMTNVFGKDCIDKRKLKKDLLKMILVNEPNLITQGLMDQHIENMFDEHDNDSIISILSCKDSQIQTWIKKLDLPRIYFTYIEKSPDGAIAQACQLFADLGFDLSYEDHYPLRFCAKQNKKTAVQVLLNNGSKIDDCCNNDFKYSALEYAIKNNHSEMVELLLKAGANQAIIDKSINISLGMTALLKKYEIVNANRDPYGFDQIIEQPLASVTRQDFSGPNGFEEKAKFFSSICAQIQEMVIMKKAIYSNIFKHIKTSIMQEFVDDLKIKKSTLSISFYNDVLIVSQ